jgi:hypothetical protein
MRNTIRALVLFATLTTNGCKHGGNESDLLVHNGVRLDPKTDMKPILTLRANGGFCTLSFVSEHVFVTAQHCFSTGRIDWDYPPYVQNWLDNKAPISKLVRNSCVFGEKAQPNILGRNDKAGGECTEYRDWAVCRSEKSYKEIKPNATDPMRIGYKRPVVGQEIIFRGYGGNLYRDSYGSYTEGRSTLSAVTSGRGNEATASPAGPIELLEIWNAKINDGKTQTFASGDSGGPVMDKDGRIIGIVRSLAPIPGQATVSASEKAFDFYAVSVLSKGFREAVEKLIKDAGDANNTGL